MWGETMKRVDMRSNMEHFSKVRKGPPDHGKTSHFDNENNGLFPRVLDEAEVWNLKIQTRKS